MKTFKQILIAIVWTFMLAAVAVAAWDKDVPSATTSLRASNPLLLGNQSAIQTSMDAEHDFGSSTQTGSHTPGSARAFFQDAAPTTQIDGGAFAAVDLGSLWFDTNSSPDNLYYVLTATTPTWTLVSTSMIAEIVATANTWGADQTMAAGFDLKGSTTSDIDFGSGNFTVAGATGAAVAQTLDIAGTVVVVGTLDDDSMATATDTTLATAESITAYVDTKESTLVTQATSSIFGTRTTTDTVSATLIKTSIYRAQCDGFLNVWTTGATAIKVFSDSNASPTTEIARDGDGDSGGGQGSSVCVPIRKDDYVQVTGGTTVTIYWTPIGTGGLVD